MNIEFFRKQKENILKIYDELKQSKLIPAEIEISGEKLKIDKNDIEEFQKNLEEEKFIVSVCGQIKAGKSTLLNSLIFKDLVLPSADIPETAKLTILNYGEKPKFKAYFYTKEEWESIKNSDYWENIKKLMNEITKKTGEILTPEEYFGKIHDHDNLSQLKDYVGAKGKYTLFVKTVELFYPSDILKEITIVDTPGTNDPDPARSAVTKEWINRSDAVIYLTYAGRAFDRADKEFIEEYLMTVPKDKIIIGVTKIDTVSDYKNVINNIERTAKDSLGEGWSKFLFEKKKPYPLAPLFSLYKELAKKVEEEEIDLPDEILEDIEDKLYEYPERNNKAKEIIEISDELLKEFKNGIYEHIINQKGVSILDSHNRKILGIFDYHIRNVEEQLAKLEDEKKILLKTDEEIEKERKKIREFSKEFIKFSEKINMITKNIQNKFDNLIDNIYYQNILPKQNELISYIDANDIDTIVNYLPWKIKEKFENLPKEINKVLKEFIEEVVKPEIRTLKADFNKLIKDNEVDLEFIIFQIENLELNNKALRETFEHIINSINSSTLESLKVKKWFFFTNDEKTKRNFREEIERLFNSIKGKLDNNPQIREVFENFINSPLEEFEENINQYIKNYRKQLESVQNKKDSLKDNLRILEEEIRELKEQLENLQKQKKEIQENLLILT